MSPVTSPDSLSDGDLGSNGYVTPPEALPLGQSPWSPPHQTLQPQHLSPKPSPRAGSPAAASRPASAEYPAAERRPTVSFSGAAAAGGSPPPAPPLRIRHRQHRPADP